MERFAWKRDPTLKSQRLQLEFKQTRDDKYILEESGFKMDEKKKSEERILPEEKPQPKKPKDSFKITSFAPC